MYPFELFIFNLRIYHRPSHSLGNHNYPTPASAAKVMNKAQGHCCQCSHSACTRIIRFKNKVCDPSSFLVSFKRGHDSPSEKSQFRDFCYSSPWHCVPEWFHSRSWRSATGIYSQLRLHPNDEIHQWCPVEIPSLHTISWHLIQGNLLATFPWCTFGHPPSTRRLSIDAFSPQGLRICSAVPKGHH